MTNLLELLQLIATFVTVLIGGVPVTAIADRLGPLASIADQATSRVTDVVDPEGDDSLIVEAGADPVAIVEDSTASDTEPLDQQPPTDDEGLDAGLLTAAGDEEVLDTGASLPVVADEETLDMGDAAAAVDDETLDAGAVLAPGADSGVPADSGDTATGGGNGGNGAAGGGAASGGGTRSGGGNGGNGGNGGAAGGKGDGTGGTGGTPASEPASGCRVLATAGRAIAGAGCGDSSSGVTAGFLPPSTGGGTAGGTTSGDQPPTPAAPTAPRAGGGQTIQGPNSSERVSVTINQDGGTEVSDDSGGNNNREVVANRSPARNGAATAQASQNSHRQADKKKDHNKNAKGKKNNKETQSGKKHQNDQQARDRSSQRSNRK